MYSNCLSGSPATIIPDISLLCGSDVGIGTRLLAGCTTGAMAVAFAQPTDVVKVRFQAQARSPGQARRYCGTIDAYKTIAKEEGIHGLWKGRLSFRGLFSYGSISFHFLGSIVSHGFTLLCHAGTAPNIARNAIVNCTELVTYDLIKDTLLRSTPLTGKTMAAG